MDGRVITDLKEIALELQRRELEDPLATKYTPHDKQIEAHRKRKPIHLVIGGNRSGKSWFAVAEAILCALGRATYAVMPKTPVVIWYVMPSLTMFRRTVLPIFNLMVPKGEIRNFAKRDGIVYFNNGSELHFLSADMRQRRLQGASVDLVIMDETPIEEVFQELQARVLDRRGRIILVFAPVEEEAGRRNRIQWIYDQLYIPWSAGDRQDIDVTLMPVADRDGNPLVPHFNKDDIARMERQWPDPATRAARMYGEFMSRTGIVYKNLNVETHIIPSFNIPQEFARWVIVDPQYHRFAALFFAADDKGFYYLTDEYFSQDDPLAHRAERMKVIIGERKLAIPVYVDSANPQDIAELNWHFQRIKAPLGAAQLPFKKTIEGSILRTQALLEPDDERKYPPETQLGDLFGAPRLLFFDRLISTWKWGQRDMSCSRLLWEMQRLAWGKDGKPDKESADGADCCDCLGYGAMIQAAGSRIVDNDAWMRKLSTVDALTWKLIEQYDSRRKNFNREL
jgi:phage terminase large subunit-like protein